MVSCEINERVISWNKIRGKIMTVKSSLKRAKADEANYRADANPERRS